MKSMRFMILQRFLKRAKSGGWRLTEGRKFMPRKISSPDGYEASNISDQFKNTAKIGDQKKFENNAPI